MKNSCEKSPIKKSVSPNKRPPLKNVNQSKNVDLYERNR